MNEYSLNLPGSSDDESSLNKQSNALLSQFKVFFEEILDQDKAVLYQDKMIKKLSVNSEDILSDRWEQYQISHMTELMAITALEMGRKAIMFGSTLSNPETQHDLADGDGIEMTLLPRSRKREKLDTQPENPSKAKSSFPSFAKMISGFLRALTHAATSIINIFWNRKSTQSSPDLSPLSDEDKEDALKDLGQYFSDLKRVLDSKKDMDFGTKIALVDHAREHVYGLLLNYKIIQNRADFQKLLNATVMWRLFDRIAVSTEIHYPSQDQGKNICITSEPWEHAYPAQDKALESYRLSGQWQQADQIIKSIQKNYLNANDPSRMRTGSQERDWYSPNAQKTTYSLNMEGKSESPVLTCWTNGDLRPLTEIYEDRLASQILEYNLKQLVLNSTGIDLSSTTDFVAKKEKFSSSTDINGNHIYLKPICILDECQSQFDINKRTHKLAKGLSEKLMPDVHQEHKNIVLREKAVQSLNAELNTDGADGDDFLIAINTPLAVHGRSFFTYHEKIKPQLKTIADRLLANYQSILQLQESDLFDTADAKTNLSAYIENPTDENLNQLVKNFTIIRSQAVLALQKNSECQQAKKVITSLCCLHDTLKHWKIYSQSRNNHPNEVLNFSSTLMCSAALLGDATMINIKCKSGKDRTGVMLTCTQTNFGYWSDPDNFQENGYPDFNSSFDCDKQPFLNQFKVLLASGAWSTSVWQDCQCPALKSLGAGIGQSNTFKDKSMNFIGDGALSQKQRECLGKRLLDFHRIHSAYNKDFHKSVSRKDKETVNSWFDQLQGKESSPPPYKPSNR